MKQSKGFQRPGIFIVILALAIMACQGGSGFNLFATATPTATATFTPSPTPTSTPTLPPTPTPHPTGKLKEVQSDGSTLFIDYDGGYQLTFPEGWVAVILEKDDLQEAFNNIPEQEENISALIEMAKAADANNLIRIFGFNIKAQQGGYAPNVNVSYDTNPLLAAISLKDLVDATVGYYPSMGIEVINSGVETTASGMETGVIEAAWSLNAPDGKKVALQQKQIIFKSGEGVGIVTFSTIKDAKVDLSDDINKLIESIQLLH